MNNNLRQVYTRLHSHLLYYTHLYALRILWRVPLPGGRKPSQDIPRDVRLRRDQSPHAVNGNAGQGPYYLAPRLAAGDNRSSSRNGQEDRSQGDRKRNRSRPRFPRPRVDSHHFDSPSSPPGLPPKYFFPRRFCSSGLSPAALPGIDIVFPARRVISPINLGDPVLELLILLAWALRYAASRKTRLERETASRRPAASQTRSAASPAP